MHNKKRWVFEGMIVILLILIAVTTYAYIGTVEESAEKINVSVAVYGNNTERWLAFGQGTSQAASDMGAVVNFVTMSGFSEWEEQAELLKRERENGTQGIVVAVSDSLRMSSAVIEMAQMTPVVLAENSLEDNIGLTYVAADGYAMGWALGELVLKNEPDASEIWAVLMEQRRSSQTERLAGFLDAVENAGREVKTMENANEEDLRGLLQKGSGCVAAALEDAALEQLVSIETAETETAVIYGIGSTQKIVYALDRGKISGIVFQNEFNMGYEAMRCLLEQIGGKTAENVAEIDYHEVTQDTLHLPENERLLYPITQ